MFFSEIEMVLGEHPKKMSQKVGKVQIEWGGGDFQVFPKFKCQKYCIDFDDMWL